MMDTAGLYTKMCATRRREVPMTEMQQGVILARVGPGAEGGRERHLRLDRWPATAERSEMPEYVGLPKVPW